MRKHIVIALLFVATSVNAVEYHLYRTAAGAALVDATGHALVRSIGSQFEFLFNEFTNELGQVVDTSGSDNYGYPGPSTNLPVWKAASNTISAHLTFSGDPVATVGVTVAEAPVSYKFWGPHFDDSWHFIEVLGSTSYVDGIGTAVDMDDYGALSGTDIVLGQGFTGRLDEVRAYKTVESQGSEFTDEWPEHGTRKWLIDSSALFDSTVLACFFDYDSYSSQRDHIDHRKIGDVSNIRTNALYNFPGGDTFGWLPSTNAGSTNGFASMFTSQAQQTPPAPTITNLNEYTISYAIRTEGKAGADDSDVIFSFASESAGGAWNLITLVNERGTGRNRWTHWGFKDSVLVSRAHTLPDTINTNTAWMLVTTVFSNGAVSFYTNGYLATTAWQTTTDTNFGIAECYANGSNEHFTIGGITRVGYTNLTGVGRLDDVLIFNRAINDTEAQYIWDNSKLYLTNSSLDN